MHSYDAIASTTAAPDVVWRLLLDARSWPDWAQVDEYVVGRSFEARAGSCAVGDVRVFRTGDVVTGERITALDPGRSMSYEDDLNQALYDYRASIELTPITNGTVIRWHGTYVAVPELESILPDYLQDHMQRSCTGLAEHAAAPR